MKKLYIAASNHMDLSWRRAFVEHFELEDGVVRPYSDIEQEELGNYFDLAERYGMKFSVEQAATVRVFLERNPDLAERFAALVKSGNIELLGGGESVIDVNLASGESIVRNQYYGIKYYERMFGTRPIHAALPDVFGVSAQIPQILRGFGFHSVWNIARVRDGRPPIFKGLDGSMIDADEPGNGFPGPVNCIADFGKYKPCPACHGNGCDVCRGSGFDLSYTFEADEDATRTHYAPTTEEFLSKHEDDEELLLTFFSEETIHSRDHLDEIFACAQKHGREVVFMTYDEVLFHSDSQADVYRRLERGGEIRPEEIDAETDLNPMACGCYTSRIEIKKENRELEALLYGAEAAAALCGEPDRFPRRMLELLWRKMGVIQFHDCITGTHTDTSYEELRRLCREVRYGAIRIRDDALRAFAAKIGTDRTYGTPFLVFNPYGQPQSEIPLRTVIEQAKTEQVEIYDARGEKCPVTDIRVANGIEWKSLQVEFLSDVPPLGYSVFYYRYTDAPVSGTVSPLPEIRNAYYHITGDAVYASDGTPLVLASLGALQMSGDHGHAWGRTKPEDDLVILLPDRCSACEGSGYSRMTFEGSYTDDARGVKRLNWTTAVTLYDGNPHIFVETKIDWEGLGRRLSAFFPLAGDPGCEAYYGIPFGVVKRDDRHFTERDGELGYFDEWPAYGYFASCDRHDGHGMIVYTAGRAGARLREDCLELSLLRAPDDPFYCVDNDGVREPGVHTARYALEAVAGDPLSVNPAAFAEQFHQEHAYSMEIPADSEGALPPRGRLLNADFGNAVLSAVKRTDDGALLVRAYESRGREETAEIEGKAVLTDFLEEQDCALPEDGIVRFAPFAIRNIKWSE